MFAANSIFSNRQKAYFGHSWHEMKFEIKYDIKLCVYGCQT